MEYLEAGVNKWVIKTHYGRSEHDGPTILFPSRPQLEQLWQEHAPGRRELLLVFEGHRFPLITNTFFVGGGRDSTIRERNKFLKAVLKGSCLAAPSLYGGPGAL